jgi:SAM-dependent methyltransferase
MSDYGSVAEVWGRLWKQGAAHSFGGADGVDDWRHSPLAEFWTRELPRKGPAHVLDLCTGNGVLLQTLVNLTDADDVTGVGVDLATVAPLWLQRASEPELRRVTIFGATNIEALPFAGSSFDWVVSQFGVEYAELGTALLEAYRVLKAGGRFVGLIHHPSARPVILAQEEICHIEWLLSQGLLDRTARMCNAMELLRSPAGASRLDNEPQWQPIRHEFDAAYAALGDRISLSTFPDFLADTQSIISEVLRSAVSIGSEVAVTRLRQFECDAVASRVRLIQMVSSAKTENQLRGALAALPGGVFEATVEPIVTNDVLMASCLRFRKTLP